jgi:hypothetical protein
MHGGAKRSGAPRQNLNAYKHGAYAESFKDEELQAKRLEQATAVVVMAFYSQLADERRAGKRAAREAKQRAVGKHNNAKPEAKQTGEAQPKQTKGTEQQGGQRVKKKYKKERPCRWWAMPKS